MDPFLQLLPLLMFNHGLLWWKGLQASTLEHFPVFFYQRISHQPSNMTYRRGDQFREALLESQVEAALGGHDLAGWEEVENGWQARCSQCQMTTWVGDVGLRYSLLEDRCPKME